MESCGRNGSGDIACRGKEVANSVINEVESDELRGHGRNWEWGKQRRFVDSGKKGKDRLKTTEGAGGVSGEEI